MCIEWMKTHNYKIKLIVDNDFHKWGKIINGYEIKKPIEIKNEDIDYIIICCINGSEEIFNQLNREFGVDSNKCITYRAIRYKEYYELLYK